MTDALGGLDAHTIQFIEEGDDSGIIRINALLDRPPERVVVDHAVPRALIRKHDVLYVVQFLCLIADKIGTSLNIDHLDRLPLSSVADDSYSTG